MNQRHFTIIILLLTIVIISGTIGYFTLIKKSTPTIQQTSTPTQVTETLTSDTANWQTYLNEEYGFEVRYPPNLMPQLEESGVVKNPIRILFVDPSSPTDEIFYSIEIIDTMSSRQMSNFFDNPEMYQKVSSATALDPRLVDIEINGMVWKGHYYVGGIGSAEPPTFVLSRDNIVFLMTNGTSYEEIKKILSTFRLLE